MKSIKFQVLIVAALWLTSILLWVFDTPLKLGSLFSQFILVFMTGFWINKVNLYQKIMSYKMAFFAVPLIVLFAYDISGIFTYNTAAQTFATLVYTDARIVALSLCAVFLALLFLKKVQIQRNTLVRKIARRSAFIYLAEPFVSYLILRLIFQEPEIYVADGTLFIVYQVTRVLVLLVLLPLAFIAVSNLLQKQKSAQPTVLPP